MTNPPLIGAATAMLLVAGCTSAPPGEPRACGSPRDPSAQADVTLTARDAAIAVRGADFIAWTYDGDVPGPVLRMELGQTRRIKLVNASPRPASLHFHGVSYAEGDDGTAGPALVNPGCAHVYTVTATQPGVWAYHSHRDPRVEMARGLHGAIVVPTPGEAPAEHEYVVFLGQLGLEGGSEAGEAGDSEEGAGSPAFFAMTVNGRPDGAAEVVEWDPAAGVYRVTPDVKFTARVGERVRWRVVNVSPDDAHTFHLHGHRWCDRGGVADAQGTCPNGSLPTDNVDLLPAQGLSLEFGEDAPGEWMLHCHIVDHANDGMYAFYDVST